MKTENTPTPWRAHDMESDAIVGPDRKAIALVMGRSRSPEEDAANLAFIIEACNSHAALLSQNGKLREALEEIEKGEGAFSRDQLTFANNVIERAKEIARAALTP